MFLYELQRATEIESLFHAQVFHLARADEASNTRAQRLETLEADVKTLQKQAAARDVDERLATSKLRMETQQGKLNACSTKLEGQAEGLEKLAKRVEELEVAKAATPLSPPPPPAPSAPEEVKESDGKEELIRAELDVLFDERDALVALLAQASDRISKLEDLVRVLTAQKSSPTLSAPSSSASASPVVTSAQTLPVQTRKGGNAAVAISVPKGNGLAFTGW